MLALPKAEPKALRGNLPEVWLSFCRLIPSVPGRLPDWYRKAPVHSLLAAMLAGAWDESSEADRAILARLADAPYEKKLVA